MDAKAVRLIEALQKRAANHRRHLDLHEASAFEQAAELVKAYLADPEPVIELAGGSMASVVAYGTATEA